MINLLVYYFALRNGQQKRVWGKFLIDTTLYLPEYDPKLNSIMGMNFLKAWTIGNNCNFDGSVIERNIF